MRTLGYKNEDTWVRRIISSKRAKKLAKQGACVWWSVEANSFVWSAEELYDRKAVREAEWLTRQVLEVMHKAGWLTRGKGNETE